ncbi:hypothetical protein PYH37_002303 [Sinorhizobium numidicum]|uniref:Exopeptide n=1 Tax=Sinorhizobium numidicum TaxID=680248 RepID=A0ABY8D205_9HYPH|nr:hypothetical protein [Sinorhizobium numidicum]WEX77502.1 hypothetical protein PYH37_002303 [Sinorhizobium numidicum]WEX84162.1 hypothetical protein PYH38_003016 [Sinorhizobium numidicum]
MPNSVVAAVIFVLVLIAVIWVVFPLEQPPAEGQPSPHAIDQSK